MSDGGDLTLSIFSLLLSDHRSDATDHRDLTLQITDLTLQITDLTLTLSYKITKNLGICVRKWTTPQFAHLLFIIVEFTYLLSYVLEC